MEGTPSGMMKIDTAAPMPTVERPHVNEIARNKHRGTENFPVGSFLIRPDLRTHVHAFYNFARAADDISDHPLLEPEEKITRLDRFAAALLSGNADDVPSVGPMRESLKETGVTPQHC